MNAESVMTAQPAYCRSHTSLMEVARLMANNDCGEIPVVDEESRPIGVVTDRDITCRAVAVGRNPLALTANGWRSKGLVGAAPTAGADAGGATRRPPLGHRGLRPMRASKASTTSRRSISMNSDACASRAAFLTSASVAFGRPIRMLSAIDRWNIAGSCGT